MKRFLLILLTGMMPWFASAQNTDSSALPDDTTMGQDHGEAGGITADEAGSDKGDAALPAWALLAIGGVAGAVIAFVIARAATPKAKTTVPVTATAAAPEETPVAEEKGNKLTIAEAKKLKQDLKILAQQLEALKADNLQLEKSLEIYRNFDSSYFGEAFRKLVMPMNEALENGSRKEIMEYLLKIMIHFTSLSRYKISKKQPYDEANIHYLLNQKGGQDTAATEVSHDTPVDKIPKNIKVIADMLKELDSRGLDDAIVAGYKIKNL